jgi:two-component system, sensor histidine kinase
MLSAVRRSIRGKLMLVMILTTFTALLCTAILLVFYDLRTYQRSWVSDLVTQADLLGLASAPALSFDDPQSAQQNLALLRIRPKISAGAIYTPNGALFASYVRDGADTPFPPTPGPEGYHIEGDQLVLVRRITAPEGVVGSVYLRARYELLARLENYLAILGAVMVVSLIVAIAMAYWLQAAIARPVLAITEAAHQVKTHRDFSLRVRRTTEDEVGYLVDAFNDMLTEVGQRADALERTNRTLEHEMAVRQEAEKALLLADQRKDEFLATLAHELRNPLAPLRTSLEILRRFGNEAPPARSAREVMDRQLRQMIRLVDDLLDVSRITTGKLILKREPVTLRTIVESALDSASPFIHARKIELAVTLPEEPVLLMADATRLAQVFMNLLNNAAKFTDPGGHISLVAQRDGDDLVVTVTDTGIGIPPDMLPVIFDMFAQLDRSLDRPQAGLGVGLSLARRLIELHGGSLEAHSRGPGHGSRFVARLPALPAGTTIEVAAAEPQRDRGAMRRVLVADDNQDFVASFAMILRALGHEVGVAHDGIEALHCAGTFRPDIAFLDIGLPGLDGYALARRIRGLPGGANVVLVAVTGWGQEADQQNARDAGFDHHVVKPIAPEQIDAMLAKSQPAGRS